MTSEIKIVVGPVASVFNLSQQAWPDENLAQWPPKMILNFGPLISVMTGPWYSEMTGPAKSVLDRWTIPR